MSSGPGIVHVQVFEWPSLGFDQLSCHGREMGAQVYRQDALHLPEPGGAEVLLPLIIRFLFNQGRKQGFREPGANAQVGQHGEIICTVFVWKLVVYCAIRFLGVPVQSTDDLANRVNPYVLAKQGGHVADPVEGPQFKGDVRRG